jgi:hypothetical protein
MCATRDTDDNKQDDADNADRQVLTIHVGLRAFLDGLCDFLHAVVARRLLQNPLRRNQAIEHCQDTRADRGPQCKLITHRIISRDCISVV